MLRKAIFGAVGAAFLAGAFAAAAPAEAQRIAPAEGLADPRRGGWDGPRRGGWDRGRGDWDRGRGDWDRGRGGWDGPRRGPPPWARGYGPPRFAGPRCRVVIQERYSYRLGGMVRRPVEVCR